MSFVRMSWRLWVYAKHCGNWRLRPIFQMSWIIGIDRGLSKWVVDLSSELNIVECIGRCHSRCLGDCVREALAKRLTGGGIGINDLLLNSYRYKMSINWIQMQALKNCIPRCTQDWALTMSIASSIDARDPWKTITLKASAMLSRTLRLMSWRSFKILLPMHSRCDKSTVDV